MRLVALDLETTGTNPQKDQILEIGMVCFESTTGEVIGEFEKMVAHPRYEGEAYALQMNAGLLKRLATEANADNAMFFTDLPALVRNALAEWGFDSQNRPVAVGFNVASFDIAFLKAAGCNLFHRRSVELGTLLMRHPETASDVPVGSSEGIKLLGDREVVHTALADCHMARELYLIAMGRSEIVTST